MAEQRKPKHFIVTPIGRLGYSHLRTPDPHPEYGGDYKASMIFTEEEFAPLKAKLDAILEEVKAEVRANPAMKRNPKYEINSFWRPIVDKETGEALPGLVEVRFKRKATFKSKKTGQTEEMKPPNLVDGLKHPIPKGVKIFSGSRVRIVFEAVPYIKPKSAGVALYFDTVQVAELSNGGSDKLDMLDEIEDGYVSKEVATDDGDEVDTDF